MANQVLKSKRLQQQEAAEADQVDETVLPIATLAKPAGKTKIKRLEMFNDWVAILRSVVDTTLDLSKSDSMLEDFGMVVGVGPGLVGTNGTRTPSQLTLGKMVMFQSRAILFTLEPKSGVFAGRHIAIVSERNLIMSLPDQAFEVVDDDGKPVV